MRATCSRSRSTCEAGPTPTTKKCESVGGVTDKALPSAYYYTMHDLVQVMLTNAEVGPDPRMGGATDCYLVPLDDIDTLRDCAARVVPGYIQTKSRETLPNGVKVVRVSCVDRDEYQGLPTLIEQDGTLYARTAWNSDTYEAYYRSDAVSTAARVSRR